LGYSIGRRLENVCAKRVGRNMRSKIRVWGLQGLARNLARRWEQKFHQNGWMRIFGSSPMNTQRSCAFDSWLFSCDPKCKNGQIRNQMAGSDPTVEDCRLFTGLAVLQGHGSLAREDLEEER